MKICLRSLVVYCQLVFWWLCYATLALANSPQAPTTFSQPPADASVESTPSESEAKNKAESEASKDLACDALEAESKSLAEKLENLGRLYKSDDNSVLQELWFLGRYHGQYHDITGPGGQEDSWENRRFRIGSQAKLFDKLTLHAQMVSGFDMDPFYNGFTELWSQWAFDDAFMVAVGQQKHRFTHDRNVSSRYINTLERSMLLNMFNADYTPAVTALGKTEKFNYYTGVFSNATGPDIVDAFTNLQSGYSLLASGTWNVNESIGLDEAFLNVCYLYSDANQEATNLNRYRDGLSAALILTQGAGSLVSEALLGARSSHGDAFGINIQPGYFLTEKLQLATRYQLAFANQADGLRAQRRYEQLVDVDNGDLYQAAYAGLNYHIAGHRIKLMNGLEYANMNGQDTWTASLAVRIFWGPNASGPFPIAKLLDPSSPAFGD